MQRTRGSALAWLGHPITLLAIALLILNDHVLKAAWPGLITGKLSDLAGMLIAPPLVMLLIGLIIPRIPDRIAAFTATGLVLIGFAFTKATEVGAQVASDAWSVLAGQSLIYQDPTDLIALPMLSVALLIWRRARLRPVRTRLVQIVVLPIALLGVMATSPAPEKWEPQPMSADAIYLTEEGLLFVPPTMSYDGGATFHRDSNPPSRISAASKGAAKDCVEGLRRCYRIIPGKLGVEQSDDDGATWTVSWEVSEGVREALRQRLMPKGGLVESLQLKTVVRPGGHVVIVANGRDGVLVRDVHGDWTRKGFGNPYPAMSLPAEPAPADDWWVVWRSKSHLGFMALLISVGAACAIALYRRGRQGLGVSIGIGMILASSLTACLPGIAELMVPQTDFATIHPASSTIATYFLINIMTLLIPLAIAKRYGALTIGKATIVTLLGLVNAAVIYVPAVLAPDVWPLLVPPFAVGLAGMLWYGYRCGKAQSTA